MLAPKIIARKHRHRLWKGAQPRRDALDLSLGVLVAVLGYDRFGPPAPGLRLALMLGVSALLLASPALAQQTRAAPVVQDEETEVDAVTVTALALDADEAGIGGDDAADALRYLIATKPREVRQRKLSGL